MELRNFPALLTVELRDNKEESESSAKTGNIAYANLFVDMAFCFLQYIETRAEGALDN